MPSAGTDKRRDKRLELKLPVKFSRKPGDSLSLFDGVTWNVSSGGVYFEALAGQVGPADPLSVRIRVRSRPDQAEPSLTLVGSGVVRRVEKLDPERSTGSWPGALAAQGVCGIAVQFQHRPTVQLHSLEQLLWEDREK